MAAKKKANRKTKKKAAKKTPKKMGRPSNFKPEYVKKIMAYFDIEPYTIQEGDDGEPTGKLIACDLPTFAGFAVTLNTYTKQLHNWCDKYPEFLQAYKKAKECQEKILVINALKGLYAAAPAIFTMKNILKWRDKHEIDMTHTGEITHTHKEGLDYNAINKKRQEVTKQVH